MNGIGVRIKKIRKSLNLTQNEFGSRIGLSAGTISGIEKGKRGIKKGIGSETLKQIAKTFNIDLHWLITGRKKPRKLPVIIADVKGEYEAAKELIPIPVIGEVPATYPEYPILNDYICDYVYLPNIPKNAFGLYMPDGSMEPEIYKDDIVIINPKIKNLEKGNLGIFKVTGDAFIRHYYPHKNGFRLQPANPEYSPTLINKDIECIVIGKAIYKIVKC